eukprot:364984-Chlamydomonas_euryale.AAC.3
MGELGGRQVERVNWAAGGWDGCAGWPRVGIGELDSWKMHWLSREAGNWDLQEGDWGWEAVDWDWAQGDLDREAGYWGQTAGHLKIEAHPPLFKWATRAVSASDRRDARA